MKNKFLILVVLFLSLLFAQSNEESFSVSELKNNPTKTEQLLVFALKTEQFQAAERLLKIYQDFPQADKNLVHYAQIRFAQQLFFNHQNRDARQAFQAAQQEDLSDDARDAVDKYLFALDERERWQFSGRAHYIYDKNVNKTSADKQIENTGFVKGDGMYPQKAHGFGYSAELEKNWHLKGLHHLHFSNEISGKNYWDHHDFDEITNRTYLGYVHQNANTQWALKPFYEQQWFGGHRYHYSGGARLEYAKSFQTKGQVYTSFEFSQPRYFKSDERDGSIKSVSVTLLYPHNPKAYLYVGADFIREQTKEKQYSNDLTSLRAGWKQTWGHEISTQLNASIANRQYKDTAVLGGVLPLDKTRRDKIYTANLTVWKENWQWHGLTPKIQFRWKRQNSNLPTMFSYSEKYAQLLIDKTF